MRKTKVPLNEKELAEYDVKMTIWELSQKYCEGITEPLEEPKKYKEYRVWTKREINKMVKKMWKELELDKWDGELLK